MGDHENERDSTNKNTRSSAETSAKSKLVTEDEDRSDNQTFSDEIDEYLKKVSSDVDVCTNPKLKKEHQRLADLLASYKRLTERLQRDSFQKFNKNSLSYTTEAVQGKSKEVRPVLPEIYAALRPDLYKDVREEEKKRFITRFAKKRTYTQAEKILPPHTVPPTYILQDRRQNEKDRFCRLVSSAPSNFTNPVGIVTKTFKPLRTFKDAAVKVENVREKEKDRLAKIFASSQSVYTKSARKPSQSVKLVESVQNRIDDDTLRLQREQGAQEADMCKSPCNQENINPQTRTSKNMVRVGEYSPLNGNHRGKTTFGIGEHEEQKKQLTEERRREYKNLMATTKKNNDLEIASVHRAEYNSHRPRMSSASTQTDSEDSSTSYQETQIGEFDSPVHSVTTSPQRRRRMDFSPREKLLSDLYGSPLVTNYNAFHDEKIKQAAYAEALRAQIEEKKRLEAERKRIEKQEEELIEKRVREQAERLRLEYVKEQNKKCDWMQQRKAQEEILRKRLEELELESKELKRQERQRRLQQPEEDESQHRATRSRRVLQKRFTSQSSNSPVSTRSRSEFSAPRNTLIKSPMLEVAPLLEADKQNVLHAKAGELRRGYNETNDEAAALALGPGVNLLSPHYKSDEEIKATAQERLGLIPVNKEEKSNLPRERYIPSLGQSLPRTVNHQQLLSGPSLRHQHAEMADELLNPPTDNLVPSNWSSNIQQETNRSPSPVIPALQTDMLLKRNPTLLEEKWKAPTSSVNDISRPGVNERLNKQIPAPKSILTQLGEFRRKLAMEHQLLEQRLKKNDS